MFLSAFQKRGHTKLIIKNSVLTMSKKEKAIIMGNYNRKSLSNRKAAVGPAVAELLVNYLLAYSTFLIKIEMNLDHRNCSEMFAYTLRNFYFCQHVPCQLKINYKETSILIFTFPSGAYKLCEGNQSPSDANG